MMKHMREVTREILETLPAEQRMVIVLLHAEQLSVAEVSEVLKIPPERVFAIAALVQCRVRMAITGGLRRRAAPLWEHVTNRAARATLARRMPRRRPIAGRSRRTGQCRHRWIRQS